MQIDPLKLIELVLKSTPTAAATATSDAGPSHPMLGRRCLVRTYSAGVHIGKVDKVEGMEVHLSDALRLWKWEGGGLSLSAVASNGIKGGRLNRTKEVYLTNAIELIPISEKSEATMIKFIEDENVNN